MPFSLQSGDNRYTLPLSDMQFREIKRGQKCIAASEAIESKFALIMSNFAVIEQEVRAIERQNPAGNQPQNVATPSTTLASALDNYLLSVRLFNTHLLRHVQLGIPKQRESIATLSQMLEKASRENFSYGLIDALHGYLVARGTITPCLKIAPAAPLPSAPVAETPASVSLYLVKSQISGERELRLSVFEGLDSQQDFFAIIKSCNAVLQKLKQSALLLLQNELASAYRVMDKYTTLFYSTFEFAPDVLFAMHTDGPVRSLTIDSFLINSTRAVAQHPVQVNENKGAPSDCLSFLPGSGSSQRAEKQSHTLFIGSDEAPRAASSE